jgi:hypothetical protein
VVLKAGAQLHVMSNFAPQQQQQQQQQQQTKPAPRQ